jgi:hypothetical protein
LAAIARELGRDHRRVSHPGVADALDRHPPEMVQFPGVASSSENRWAGRRAGPRANQLRFDGSMVTAIHWPPPAVEAKEIGIT